MRKDTSSFSTNLFRSRNQRNQSKGVEKESKLWRRSRLKERKTANANNNKTQLGGQQMILNIIVEKIWLSSNFIWRLCDGDEKRDRTRGPLEHLPLVRRAGMFIKKISGHDMVAANVNDSLKITQTGSQRNEICYPLLKKWVDDPGNASTNRRYRSKLNVAPMLFH